MATKKTESTMKTVGVKNTAVITDGCNPELVRGAFFDGLFQIPVIKGPEIIAIPKALCPFSKREKVVENQFAHCFYENDIEFADIHISLNVKCICKKLRLKQEPPRSRRQSDFI